MNIVILGLGSNLGDKEKNLQQAIELLKKNNIINQVVVSNIYRSKALLQKNSPKEWDLDFVNIAIKACTELDPHQLLQKCKKIEIDMGRDYLGKWAPRIIDVDILAYDNIYMVSEKLTIPHKELLNRDFAKIPFIEVWPDWKYPVKNSKEYNIAIKFLVN